MTTEEITKVAEIIGNLGDKAGEGLITYLCFDFAGTVLGFIAFVVFIKYVYSLVWRLRTAESEDCKLRSKINDVYKLTTHFGYDSAENQVEEIEKYIVRLKEKVSK